MAECGTVAAWVAVLLLVLCSGGQLSWPRRPPTLAEITDVSRALVPLFARGAAATWSAKVQVGSWW